jgi:RimJ/RimL family protein N-acetyltransferase
MEGKLVRLRAYEKSDLDAVMKWVNDEGVTQFLRDELFAYPVSRAQEERFIEHVSIPSHTSREFALETIADRTYLGGIGLHDIDWILRSAEAGIVIGNKDYWGKGYGTDAMRTLMRLAFDRMNMHRVWLRVYDFNVRAIASYERCGFQRWGVLRDGKFIRGRYHDTIVMGILESEYRALL